MQLPPPEESLAEAPAEEPPPPEHDAPWRPSDRRIAIAWTALALLSGTNWMAVRVALRDLPPLTLSGTRFLIAVPLLALILVVRNRRRGREARDADPHGSISPTKAEWRILISIGVQVFVVGNAMLFWGQQYVPSGVAAVVSATAPAAGMLLAWVRIRDPISPGRGLGAALAIGGVALIYSGQIQGVGGLAGAGLLGIIGSMLCLANASVTVRGLGHRIDPLFIAMVQMSIAAVAHVVASIAVESPDAARWTPTAVGATVWLAVVGAVIGFWLFYWLMRYIEVLKVLSMLLVTPIIALLLGWTVLGEQVGVAELGGAALVLSGLYLVLSARGSASS